MCIGRFQPQLFSFRVNVDSRHNRSSSLDKSVAWIGNIMKLCQLLQVITSIVLLTPHSFIIPVLTSPTSPLIVFVLFIHAFLGGFKPNKKHTYYSFSKTRPPSSPMTCTPAPGPGAPAPPVCEQYHGGGGGGGGGATEADSRPDDLCGDYEGPE